MNTVIIFDIKEEYEAYTSGMSLSEIVNPEGYHPLLYQDCHSSQIAFPLGYKCHPKELDVKRTPVTFFKNTQGVEVGIIYKHNLREVCGSPAYFLNQIADSERKNHLLTTAGNEQREQITKAVKRIATLENKLNAESRKNDRNFMERLIYLFRGY